LADEDIELVRRVWAAFTRGDEDEFRRDLHPEIVAVPFGAKLEGKEYRGYDQVLSWWKDEILVTWEHFEVYPERFERVASFPLESSEAMFAGVQLAVYRSKVRNPAPARRLSFEMIGLGQSLGADLH